MLVDRVAIVRHLTKTIDRTHSFEIVIHVTDTECSRVLIILRDLPNGHDTAGKKKSYIFNFEVHRHLYNDNY